MTTNEGAELTAADVQKLAAEAGADQPVMSVKVVGDRVELHLLGGMVVPVTPPSHTEQSSVGKTAQQKATTPNEVLDKLTVRQLKALAAEAGLSNYRKANKAALIVMLSEHYTTEELEALVAPF